MESEVGDKPFDAKLMVRRINRWMLGASLLPGLAGLALVLFAGSHPPENLSTWFALSVLSATGVSYVLRRRPSPILVEEGVHVEPGALYVGGVATPRSQITDAQLVPTAAGGVFVRVSRRGRIALDLEVQNRDEGRKLLRALGFDASQTVAKFRVFSRVLGHWSSRSGLALFALVVMFISLAVLFESWPALWAFGLKGWGLLFASFMAAIAVPSSVYVGADGVLLTWLGTKRFVPLGTIRSVERSRNQFFGNRRQIGALLTLDDAKTLWIPVGDVRWADDRARALVERIREALETHAQGRVETATSVLGRRARGVRDWIQELRAIGAGATADLRTAAIHPDQLWRVVESHGAEPEDRAAAAVALSSGLDETGKQRLRIAVETVADERLRVAIGAAVTDDGAALEAAMNDVSRRDSARGRA